ncbi:vacuolar alkaline phosphatase [Coemansia sp. Benny D115]|nr:vacuolar alkaline phosphatase [Coemansia sp. Benny D115]
MISDGFGMASEAMARAYVQKTGNRDIQWASLLDSMLVGTTRTRSTDTLVTDSAAGATAFSCAQKSFNSAIGVSKDRLPCGTVLEAAKHKGYVTGLVTTARISHATPAAFAAHVVHRDMEDLIAQQMIGAGLNMTVVAGSNKGSVDLMFGGGRCFFLPKSSPDGCRGDELDLWKMAQSHGYVTLATRKEFDEYRVPSSQIEARAVRQLPVLGLFDKGHLSFEIDRKPQEQPSLSEMTAKALSLLKNAVVNSEASVNGTDNDGAFGGGSGGVSPGFFVMIEGARIDMAGHDNDPAAHLRDILEYWKTVSLVREFVDNNPDTLLISTSDHETGGLSLGIDPDYAWFPEALHPVHKSAEAICIKLRSIVKATHDRAQVEEHITNVVMPRELGISDFTSSEVSDILAAAGHGTKACKQAVGHVVSDRAHIGWTTGGHTGADVGLYAYGHGSEKLRGSLDNTQVGEFLAAYLGVDLNLATEALAHIPTVQRDFVR